jgi:hypothetical protein
MRLSVVCGPRLSSSASARDDSYRGMSWRASLRHTWATGYPVHRARSEKGALRCGATLAIGDAVAPPRPRRTLIGGWNSNGLRERSSSALSLRPGSGADTMRQGKRNMPTETKTESVITPEMVAAGLKVLVDSGVLDHGTGREPPTGADEILVADIYRAMARGIRVGEPFVDQAGDQAHAEAMGGEKRSRREWSNAITTPPPSLRNHVRFRFGF